jgi:hypothetical protein
MDRSARDDALPPRQARQFSVRELLILTFAASLILAIGVSSRGSTYFHAFASPWALASLVPPVVVLAVGRFNLASRRTFIISSIALYAAALCSPALGLRLWQSNSLLWGYTSFFFSMMVLPQALWALVAFWNYSSETFEALAFLLGDLANVAYITGAILYFVGSANSTPKALVWCRRAAFLGAIFAVATLLPIASTADLMAIYPGFGLWVASFLALAFAARIETLAKPSAAATKPPAAAS